MTVIVSAGAVGPYTGWFADTNTWTYASASSFTVSGDFTSVFQPGTLVSCAQTGRLFFVVTSSSFASSTTTVNITGGSDYTLANATITSPLYSYSSNPQGWPGWFNWSPTIVGFASSPTVNARFSVVGRVCTILVYINGTNGGGIVSFTLPIATAGVTVSSMLVPVTIENAGTRATGSLEIDTSTSTLANVFPAPSGGSWSSGSQQVFVTTSYAI